MTFQIYLFWRPIAKYLFQLHFYPLQLGEPELLAVSVAGTDIKCHTAGMASVVFFRAVNVGGHQKFQPGILAKELAHLGGVNIGAAGTFVVREHVSPAKLRDAILRRLPFRPELMI